MEDTLRQRKIEKVVSQRQEGIIILEDIHDPHNAAAVIRTAEALGFQKVYYIFVQEKRFNPSHLGKSSSSSANKWLDFKIFKSTEECLNEIKGEGYQVVATLLDETVENLFEARLTKKKIAIVLGNEHRGLSPTAIKMADRKIYLPMVGMVQSLNLSVTAAIMMYEVARQREKVGKKKYFLEKKEVEGLIKEFGLR